MTDRFQVRCYESGEVIDTFSTFEDASSFLRSCENDDRKEGTYTDGFYEIYDTVTDGILVCKHFVSSPITTTKRVSTSGGALKISITPECNALGIGVGDYVEITIRRL